MTKKESRKLVRRGTDGWESHAIPRHIEGDTEPWYQAIAWTPAGEPVIAPYLHATASAAFGWCATVRAAWRRAS